MSSVQVSGDHLPYKYVDAPPPNWDTIQPMTGSHIPGVDTGARGGQTTFMGSGGPQTITSGMGSFGGGFGSGGLGGDRFGASGGNVANGERGSAVSLQQTIDQFDANQQAQTAAFTQTLSDQTGQQALASVNASGLGQFNQNYANAPDPYYYPGSVGELTRGIVYDSNGFAGQPGPPERPIDTLSPVNVTAPRLRPQNTAIYSDAPLGFRFWLNGPAGLFGGPPRVPHEPNPRPVAVDYVKTGLGDGVDKLLAKSPTAEEQLRKLLAAGWAITWAKPGDASSTDAGIPGGGTIYITAAVSGNPRGIAQQLAHELGHFAFGSNADLSSSQACLRAEGDGEGAATINNITIEREILADGGPDIGVGSGSPDPIDTVQQYNTIYDQAARYGDWAGARDRIGSIYLQSEHDGSTPPRSYHDIYSGYCDQATIHAHPRHR